MKNDLISIADSISEEEKKIGFDELKDCECILASRDELMTKEELKLYHEIKDLLVCTQYSRDSRELT